MASIRPARLRASCNRRRPITMLILATLAIGGAHAADTSADADGSTPQNAKQLGTVTVTGSSGLDLYRSNDASTGALGQRSLLDTPFSISAATSDLIQNR